MEDFAWEINNALADWQQQLSFSNDAPSAEINQSELRHCLRRLDRVMNEWADRCKRADVGASDNSENSVDNDKDHFIPLPEIPLYLRSDLFIIVTQIDLVDLGIQDDVTTRLYFNVCDQCLTLLLGEEGGAVRNSEEAIAVMNRITCFLDNQESVGDDAYLVLYSDKVIILGKLFRLIHNALFQLVAHRNRGTDGLDTSTFAGGQVVAVSDSSQQGDRSNGSDSSSSDTMYSTRMQDLLQSVETLELFQLILPVARSAMRLKVWKDVDQMHMDDVQDTYRQMRLFIGYLLEHVLESINIDHRSSLLEWLQSKVLKQFEQQSLADVSRPPVVPDDAEVERKADHILYLIQAYRSELLEYSVDHLDEALSFFNSRENSSSSEQKGDNDPEISSKKLRCVQETNIAWYTLRQMELLRLANTPIIASVKHFWVSFTTFVLAARLSESSEESAADAITSLLRLGHLALQMILSNEAAGPSFSLMGESLDPEIQHSLSVSILSAIDFPDILLQNPEFLGMLEKFALKNSELRQLVQGAALRGMMLPTNGSSRNKAAMNEVNAKLVEIGLSTRNTTVENSGIDPWDHFFHKQILERREQLRREPRDRSHLN